MTKTLVFVSSPLSMQH